jgi:hypothetical protein
VTAADTDFGPDRDVRPINDRVPLFNFDAIFSKKKRQELCYSLRRKKESCNLKDYKRLIRTAPVEKQRNKQTEEGATSNCFWWANSHRNSFSHPTIEGKPKSSNTKARCPRMKKKKNSKTLHAQTTTEARWPACTA